MRLQNKAASVCLFLAVSACALAQTVTGSLVGTVVDPAGSVIPGAPVILTNQGTAAILKATTDHEGLFRFPNLSPATYTVTVQAKGFKTRVERDISVGLSENRDVGRLGLEIGNVGESITVTAEVTPVQTSSSERSSVIDGNQLNSEAIRGREM